LRPGLVPVPVPVPRRRAGLPSVPAPAGGAIRGGRQWARRRGSDHTVLLGMEP